MLRNFIAFAAYTDPGALGGHLEEFEVNNISDSRVSRVAVKLELKYPLVGSPLLDVFYLNKAFKSPANVAFALDGVKVTSGHERLRADKIISFVERDAERDIKCRA
jgi:hypothetical protein